MTESITRFTEYGYAELMRDLHSLRRAYPFLHVESIGESVMGKSIPALRLGEGPREVHANGAFHANEWITSLMLMKFAEEYARACCTGGSLRGESVRPLFENTSLWLVPMVNPDGVELVLRGVTPQHPFRRQLLEWNGGSSDFSGWKANIRGVDLNDQFPACWDEEKRRRSPSGPGPRDYAGTAPLTEPEAAAMAEFTRRRRFCQVLAFHTQGREIYWNYRGMEPPESAHIAERYAKESGYTPVRLTDSDAGYKDWFIQEFRRPGFTIEAGFGTNPLPLSQCPEMYLQTEGILLACLTM